MKFILDRKPKMRYKPFGIILDPDKYFPISIPLTWRIKPKKHKKKKYK